MEGNRRLVVIRHAKAEAFAPQDSDRVLSDDGRADAAVLGDWLRAKGVVADAAYVSSAARAQETWQLVAEGAGWDVEPRIEGLLYSTDEEGVLEYLRETHGIARTVVVVGHNPTVAMLVQLLDDGEGSDADVTGFPTATAAFLDVPGDWADLSAMGARLSDFHVARA